MRVLFLSPRQSWPPNTGAKLRDYHFARALGQRAELTYIHFAGAGDEPDDSAWPFAQQVIHVPRPKGYTVGKVFRGIFGRWPLTVENYTADSMKAALGRIAAVRPDLTHLDAIQL